MKKGIYTLIGFLLFILGGSALVLSLVGVQLSFLVWIDNIGGVFGFLLKIIMLISGIVIAVLSTTNWEKENQDDPIDETPNSKG